MNQFIVQHQHLTASSPVKKALVFRLVVNGMGIFWVLMTSFITAPLIGTIVGLLYRPDVGMETAIVIFAMIPALGMLGAWIQGFDSSMIR